MTVQRASSRPIIPPRITHRAFTHRDNGRRMTIQPSTGYYPLRAPANRRRLAVARAPIMRDAPGDSLLAGEPQNVAGEVMNVRVDDVETPLVKQRAKAQRKRDSKRARMNLAIQAANFCVQCSGTGRQRREMKS